MNERIKQLIQEKITPVATIGNWGIVDWADQVYPQLGDKMYADTDLERFAKLIVQDCVDILAGYRGRVTWKNEDEMHQHPISVIQKHFGVKE